MMRKPYLKLTKDEQNILKRAKKGSMDTEDIETAIRIYEKMNRLNRAVYYAKQLAEKTRTIDDYRSIFRLLVSDGSCLAAARLAREKNLICDAKDLYEKAIYDREISGRITDAYQVALEKATLTGDEKDNKRAKELDWLAANYYYPMLCKSPNIPGYDNGMMWYEFRPSSSQRLDYFCLMR